jgi:hypothetical protein
MEIATLTVAVKMESPLRVVCHMFHRDLFGSLDQFDTLIERILKIKYSLCCDSF